MFDNVTHPGLRARLQFEATKLGIPIDYQEVQAFPTTPSKFASRIDLLVYSGPETATLALPLPGGEMAYKGPYSAPGDPSEDAIRLGAEDGQDGVLTAHSVNNRILVFLSLETMFRQAEEHTSSNLDGAARNPANQVFDAIIPKALALAARNIQEHDWSGEAEAYARMKVDLLDRSTREWREEIARNERDIDEATWKISGLVSRSERLREALARFQDTTRMHQRRKAVEEHASMVRLQQAGSIKNLSFESGQVRFETGQVDIDFDDYDYRLGPFRVELDIGEGTLRIHGMPGAPKVDGYHHPHVASGGTPCLGNMAPVIAKTLGVGDVVAAIGTVLEFLRSYNDGNGYVDLRRWNPDWEDDDDRFESCYDNSALHDCAVCSDEACPHQDEAELTCYDNHSVGDCIDCGDCGYRDNAIEACRNDHDPWECTECTRACSWAGDVQACHDHHDGERCKDCPLDECRNHPRKDDDATDGNAEPADGGA